MNLGFYPFLYIFIEIITRQTNNYKIKLMRKSILVLATAFTLTAFFTSCRDTKKESDDMEMSDDMDGMHDDMDNVGDDLEEAADDTGDAIENAADETGDALENAANEVEAEVEGTDDM